MHSARFACKKMKWDRKTRERELPGMEALSFTVLVALVSQQLAMVADVGSPSSLLCFDVFSSSSVFLFPC
jgi:hypothetical protein